MGTASDLPTNVGKDKGPQSQLQWSFLLFFSLIKSIKENENNRVEK